MSRGELVAASVEFSIESWMKRHLRDPSCELIPVSSKKPNQKWTGGIMKKGKKKKLKNATRKKFQMIFSQNRLELGH